MRWLKIRKGFIDLHTHGIGRYDTRTENPEDILKIAKLHARCGASAILPTIYSGTIQQMRANMEAVKKAMRVRSSEFQIRKLKTQNLELKSSIVSRQSSLILGVHLEGPFLNPARCGAQDKKTFIKPSISNLRKLIDGYEDIIKVITIAPEVKGALAVIEKCVSLGIKVNMGHSDATYKQALDGKKAGATGITHIFNAMKPFHHRDLGLAGLGLLDEDIYIEVIADNIHLDKKTLELIFKVKRPDRIILVSDSVKGAGIKKAPIYSKAGVLAGGATTLADAARNLENIGVREKVVLETSIENPKKYLQ